MTQHWIKVTYNYNTDETKIKTSENWKDLPSIHRLDAIQDAKADIETLYQETYKEHIGGYKEPLIGEVMLSNLGHAMKGQELSPEIKKMVMEDAVKQMKGDK